MAVAGCINAYDCSGCLIRTLECLQSSNIGVGVQYCAPNPLDDKRFDYIKYTDKCGCVQCLSAENEILIYATDGVIKNLTLTNDDVNEAIKIKWNDIFGSNRAKTIVRYKTGSAPVSITDGTLAVEETTKNQYSSTAYSLTGVLDETTYYFTAFAVDGDGTIINVQSNSITTSFSTIQTFDFQNNGQLNWTLSYDSSSTNAGYTSGQGFYTRSSSGYNVETRLAPPNSIYNNETLKRIRLWFYKPSTKWGFGPGGSSWTYGALTYQGDRDATNATKLIKGNGKYNGTALTGNAILSQAYNGEILFDINILSNGVSGTLGGESFVINDSNIANALRQLWSSKVFRIFNANRGNTTNAYIRKVEITTK